MKNQLLTKMMLLLFALVAGSSSVWAEDVITEGFETASTGNDYQSTVTVATNKSDCGVSWEIYYGCVSTSSKISGNNSAALRLYTTDNYGYLKTTSAINDLRRVSFKAKASTSNSAKIKINLLYSTDGTNWSAIKDGNGDDVTEMQPGTSASKYTYDIPTGGKYFKIEISSNSTKPTKSNAQLTIDDVEFTSGIYNPATAVDGALATTITYSGGTITEGVWTMTANSDYTFFSTTDGKVLAQRSGKPYFKMAYPASYKITVPSTVAVSKIAITGYSASTSNTTVTVGETTQTFYPWESTLYFDIASPSAGADVTFSTANKEMDIISIELYTADGITITTSDNMNGWRSFYDATQAYTVDANTTIYTIPSTSGSSVTMNAEAGNVIPAGSPVILKTTAGDHKMVLTKTDGTATLSSNILAVTNGSSNVDGYRLGYKADPGIAFYKYTTTTAPAAGIVYIPAASMSAPEFLTFDFGETTAIKTVNTEKANVAPRKMLKDGRIVIETAEGTFLMNGSRVK